jgi:vancomycin resistance protein YoaR
MLCLWTLSRRSRETTRKIVFEQPVEETVSRYVSALATEVNREPSNPVFGEAPDKTVTLIEPGVVGLRLREPEAASAIRDAVMSGSDTVRLPVETAPPSLGSTDPDELGIRELIAEATTDFRGSPKNRVWNIRHALERFQGFIIAPDEEFSFVTVLGEVDEEHGYLPELVIKNNKTEPEYGGGICQVSTTVFQTAIHSGMKITARRNHAYPVSYYKPYGMDATVYVPLPDLRFFNNTPGHVLIVPSIEETRLTVRFYGTSDGRTVEIDGPHILESNPDGSMKTVFLQTVKDSAGETLIADEFKSDYKSPDLYPHPEEFTEKPADWSKRQWEEYLAAKTSAGN